MPADTRSADAAMDAASLYREEIVTDRKVGTIRMMVPIKDTGAPDTARPTVYSGEAQIMTNMGALPVSFDIEAKNLAEAVANYGEAAKIGIERTMRELQELRRQASSGLIVPPRGRRQRADRRRLGGIPAAARSSCPKERRSGPAGIPRGPVLTAQSADDQYGHPRGVGAAAVRVRDRAFRAPLPVAPRGAADRRGLDRAPDSRRTGAALPLGRPDRADHRDAGADPHRARRLAGPQGEPRAARAHRHRAGLLAARFPRDAGWVRIPVQLCARLRHTHSHAGGDSVRRHQQRRGDPERRRPSRAAPRVRRLRILALRHPRRAGVLRVAGEPRDRSKDSRSTSSAAARSPRRRSAGRDRRSGISSTRSSATSGSCRCWPASCACTRSARSCTCRR